MENLTVTPEYSLDWVLSALNNQQTEELTNVLFNLHVSEIANLLESMPLEPRQALWQLVDPEVEGEVLPYLHDEVRATIIDDMDDAELVAAAEHMDIEDLVDVIEELPQALSDTIVESLDLDRRARLERVLSYKEGSAGRLMMVDVLSVRPDVTLAVVLRWLRRHDGLPVHTDALMVTDSNNVYLGQLSMEALVTSAPESLVSDVMSTESDTVKDSMPEHDIAALFERRDLVSVAVLDDAHCLVGRITIDDVVDVIREEAEQAYLKSAGLDQEEDLFAPVVPSAKRRGLWLGINLVTVFMAAWVIGQFEEALSQLVALAVLMPVVASMGGIAGSQTLTLTIRGLALDQIAAGNTRWLLKKEVAVGALNGVVWSIVVAIVAYLWFGEVGLSIVIALAIIINMLAAAISGIIVPLVLKKFGVDPALSGAVVLTTVTDIMGFLSFLGLATIFLL